MDALYHECYSRTEVDICFTNIPIQPIIKVCGPPGMYTEMSLRDILATGIETLINEEIHRAKEQNNTTGKNKSNQNLSSTNESEIIAIKKSIFQRKEEEDPLKYYAKCFYILQKELPLTSEIRDNIKNSWVPLLSPQLQGRIHADSIFSQAMQSRQLEQWEGTNSVVSGSSAVPRDSVLSYSRGGLIPVGQLSVPLLLRVCFKDSDNIPISPRRINISTTPSCQTEDANAPGQTVRAIYSPFRALEPYNPKNISIACVNNMINNNYNNSKYVEMKSKQLVITSRQSADTAIAVWDTPKPVQGGNYTMPYRRLHHPSDSDTNRTPTNNNNISNRYREEEEVHSNTYTSPQSTVTYGAAGHARGLMVSSDTRGTSPLRNISPVHRQPYDNTINHINSYKDIDNSAAHHYTRPLHDTLPYIRHGLVNSNNNNLNNINNINGPSRRCDYSRTSSDVKDNTSNSKTYIRSHSPLSIFVSSNDVYNSNNNNNNNNSSNSDGIVRNPGALEWNPIQTSGIDNNKVNNNINNSNNNKLQEYKKQISVHDYYEDTIHTRERPRGQVYKIDNTPPSLPVTPYSKPVRQKLLISPSIEYKQESIEQQAAVIGTYTNSSANYTSQTSNGVPTEAVVPYRSSNTSYNIDHVSKIDNNGNNISKEYISKESAAPVMVMSRKQLCYYTYTVGEGISTAVCDTSTF